MTVYIIHRYSVLIESTRYYIYVRCDSVNVCDCMWCSITCSATPLLRAQSATTHAVIYSNDIKVKTLIHFNFVNNKKPNANMIHLQCFLCFIILYFFIFQQILFVDLWNNFLMKRLLSCIYINWITHLSYPLLRN